MKKIITILFLIITQIFCVSGVFAFNGKEEFPKVANYYLQPLVPSEHYDDLSRYDLVILDADTQTVDPKLFEFLKNKNKDIQILAYMPSQSVNIEVFDSWARLRKKIYDKIETGNWWLKDSSGNHISFSNIWPSIRFVDIGNGWSDYLSDLIASDVISKGVWDGVFLDMVFANLSWLNDGDIDIDNNGKKDDISFVNSYWQKNSSDLITKTKNKIGNGVVVANVDIVDKYNNELDGIMMENFPAEWLGENGWSILEKKYLQDSNDHRKNKVYIINANSNNQMYMDNYRKMRFGLASTLLGDGYFSFDFGDQNHSQTWWYDEYEVVLGKATSEAYNLLDKNNKEIKAGLWRRDFENGVALVNSTNKDQIYVFQKEEFEKINGLQDKRTNNGSRINWIKLPAEDGVVLLKINNEIKNNSFDNGGFVRVFDRNGRQERNGFFAYEDSFSGGAQVLLSDVDNDGSLESLVNDEGKISIYKNGKQITKFQPYEGKFKGDISFAVEDMNGDGTKEIITGAGLGGGPHIRIFSNTGKVLSAGFFAYDKNFRGGVNVAVMDLNGDGTKEIITGAGPGGGSHVRVFSSDGRVLSAGFFAYNKNFRGGVTIAVGDTNGDGTKEIITGAGPGGETEVKIFTKDGEFVNSFFAYDRETKDGIKVMSDDINRDRVDDILVSVAEY